MAEIEQDPKSPLSGESNADMPDVGPAEAARRLHTDRHGSIGEDDADSPAATPIHPPQGDGS